MATRPWGAPVLWVTEPVEIWFEGGIARFRITSDREQFEFSCSKGILAKGLENIAMAARESMRGDASNVVALPERH